jgi:hypothetical protein
MIVRNHEDVRALREGGKRLSLMLRHLATLAKEEKVIETPAVDLSQIEVEKKGKKDEETDATSDNN